MPVCKESHFPLCTATCNMCQTSLRLTDSSECMPNLCYGDLAHADAEGSLTQRRSYRGHRQSLSIIVHRKCFCCISEQQCSMKIDPSGLRALVTLCRSRFFLPSSISPTLTEQSNSEDVSFRFPERACQDVGFVYATGAPVQGLEDNLSDT